MTTLKADNRELLTNAKYAFLVDNYSSASTSVVVTNASDFSADKFVLLGNFGSENSEIRRVLSTNNTTQTITFTAATTFAHNESTKISIIPYNQIIFYRTTTTTFSASAPLTGFNSIQANSWFTTFDDDTNSTGYGWFKLYNSVSTLMSAASNPIPYTGFARDTIKQLFDGVLSLLNNKELKIVTTDDLYIWSNEGYEMLRNSLNMVNQEYGAQISQPISVVSGTSEYLLATDFGNLINITDQQDLEIPFISLNKTLQYDGNVTKYYIRGKYVGFVPAPTASTTYTYNYVNRAPVLDSYEDVIDLPNGGFYCLKDFVMYRACLKTNNPNAANYYKIFGEGTNNMKIFAIKRDANKDSWSIISSANI